MEVLSNLTRLVQVRDGRYLCVVESGDPAGTPAFYLHGGPASRIGGLAFDEVAREHGIRLLTPDRPGMGFSEPRPGRRVADWADDIADIAASYGLDQFGVFGASGGGPYALACARYIPHLLTATVVASGIGPMADDDRMLADYNSVARFFLRRAGSHPRIMRLAVYLMTKPSKEDGKNKFTDMATGDAPKSDQEVQAWLESIPALAWEPVEVRRQGLRYAAQDLACIAGKWGFRVAEIGVPVMFWHGEEDGAVPVSNARLLSEQIPGSELHVVPGGHNIAFTESPAIFRALRAAADGERR